MNTWAFWGDLLGKAIWAILCFICGLFLNQVRKLRAKDKQREEALNDDMKVIKDALRHTLRGVLISDYEKFMKRGWCTYLEKQEYQATYETYHALNGNGVVTHKDQEIMNLPEHP